MSRHVLYAGRVVSLGAVDRTSLARVVLDIATGYEHLAASRETAAAIAADGLLFTDVEVTIDRVGGPASSAADERKRHLTTGAENVRLERALANAEQRERELRADVERERARVEAAEAVVYERVLDLRALRERVRREVNHAGFVAAHSDSDAIRGAMSHTADRLRDALHAQPPHGGGTDVERVARAVGRIDGFSDDGTARIYSPARVWLATINTDFGALGGTFRSVCDVEVSVRAVESVDPAKGVGDEASESGGSGGGREHDGNVMASSNAGKSV